MKKITLHHILKMLSVVGALCCFYPILALAYLLTTKRLPNGESLLWLAAFVTGGGFGFLLSLLFLRLEKRGKTTPALRKLLCGMIGIGLWLLLWTCNGVSPFILRAVIGSLLLISFFLGTWFVFRDYRDILNELVMILAASANVAVIFLLWALQASADYSLEYDYNGFVGVFLLVIILFLIMRNQGNIDYLMERRHHKLSHLPKRIRYYNMALLSGILAILIAVFCLRHQLTQLLLLVKDGLVSIAAAVWRFLMWLASLFASDELAPAEPQEPEMPGGMGDPVQDGMDWTFLFILILLAALFCFRKKIWRAFCSLVRKIRQVLLGFFRRTGMERSAQEGSAYYYDRVEDLTSKNLVKESKRFGRRSFRKAYKAYQTMPRDESRLRFGYRLLMQWFPLAGVSLNTSDTTWDIFEKGSQKLSKEEFAQMTEHYNEVCYGGGVCLAAGLQEMDDLVRQAASKALKD